MWQYGAQLVNNCNCDTHSDPTLIPSPANYLETNDRVTVDTFTAMARWAMLVERGFDFDVAFRDFLDGYRIPVTAGESVRGSRCGELIARCMVETGTSSFYTALAHATDEPVLQDICRRIADDEFAHYEMFYRHMRRYLDVEQLGFLARFKVALSRIAETEDDELAYAYFAANGRGEPYNRRYHGGLYHRAALSHYTPASNRR